MTSRLLVLGGTSEGKALVARLIEYGVPVVYSVAGLVRLPQFKQPSQSAINVCEVIHGGFQSFGGLANYLSQHPIVGVCDATHPFAEKMSKTAWQSCQQLGLPYWRYQRAEWPQHPDDDWMIHSSWLELLNAIPLDQRVFFSAGQLTDASLQWLQHHPDQTLTHLWRTAVEVTTTLPKNLSPVKAIGPFELTQERALFQTHNIGCLVTKNSGGSATFAKMQVARELGVPVHLLARPAPVPESVCYHELDKLGLIIISQLKLNCMMQVH